MNSFRAGCAAACLTALVGGCSVDIDNQPINQPWTGATPTASAAPSPQHQETVVGLAFSGGGTRAAAFSFGVLKALAKTPAPDGTTLLHDVDLVSGVSGGSITAAYFGYRGEASLDDFRERFLVQDMESALRTSFWDPTNWLRLIEGGGVNDRRGAQAWLDAHLFGRSTFADLERPDRPVVWINASDIYNATPFVFDHQNFDALCSDLTKLPISEAVAASAAVPVAFAPIVIQSYAGACKYELPAWATKALKQPSDLSGLQDYAQALANYQNPQVEKYVKLLDGGLIDNYGLASVTLRREEYADLPYAPLTPEQAVNVKKLLFVVVDAGQSTDNSWVLTPHGPAGVDLAMAAVNTPLNSSKRASLDLFNREFANWQRKLVHYRCKELSEADIVRLRGSLAGWKCDDVHFTVAMVSFDLLDPPDRDRLSQLPTSLALPASDVDALIAGGGEALARAAGFKAFYATPAPRIASLGSGLITSNRCRP
ncbi:MAG TPA: patatin-like phospholipase family protein [Rhizomicrobium sp.]|nr:patatin-like phospholipase family protein [Rhizomicrobium sp.]